MTHSENKTAINAKNKYFVIVFFILRLNFIFTEPLKCGKYDNLNNLNTKNRKILFKSVNPIKNLET